jgi:hypothetical protein
MTLRDRIGIATLRTTSRITRPQSVKLTREQSTLQPGTRKALAIARNLTAPKLPAPIPCLSILGRSGGMARLPT